MLDAALDGSFRAVYIQGEDKAGDDTIGELNLTRSRRLQSCDLSVRQTYFVRHMYLLP